MDAVDLAGPCFELAHFLPGRIRLLWWGDGEPPAALVARLSHSPGVSEVTYRPASRSLLIHHGAGFDLGILCHLAGEFDVPLLEPAPRETRQPEVAEGAPAGRPRRVTVRDVEAVLTLVLVLSWARDLIVTRTFRLSTFLLIVITCVSLYQAWWTSRPSPAGAPDGQDLAGELGLADR